MHAKPRFLLTSSDMTKGIKIIDFLSVVLLTFLLELKRASLLKVKMTTKGENILKHIKKTNLFVRRYFLFKSQIHIKLTTTYNEQKKL